MDLCKLCNNRPVFIRKRKLCSSCYQKLYREGKIPNTQPRPDRYKRRYEPKTTDSLTSTIAINKYERLGELEFIKNYFTHQNWIPQPANFYFANLRYTPDFYDIERNVFIEVSRTKQAYSRNRRKYELFKKSFPKLNFEIRKPSGELLNEDRPINAQLRLINT